MAKAPKTKTAVSALPPEQRRPMGKALRDVVPRSSHGEWKPAADRADPVELTLAANVGRIQSLVPIRHGRMMASPFAFYRGSAGLMAADLATTPSTGLIVQACGDAHLANFGGFATPERNLVFDINDFDETLPAPWEWDVKRLTASVVIAGQHNGISATAASKAARATVQSYREHMNDYASMQAMDVWYDKIDMPRVMKMMGDDAKLTASLTARIDKERKRAADDHDFDMLVDTSSGLPRIKDNPPLIFHPGPDLLKGLNSNFSNFIAQYRKSLPHHVRVLFDRYTLYDVAIKVVGVGSVGTQCMIGLFMASDDDPLFLQVKEARASVLEPFAGKSQYPHHGQRVVEGQRLVHATSDIMLGWGTSETGKQVYVRQMRDLKIKALIETWDENLLTRFSRICAWALARSHARSGDPAQIAGYMGSGDTFDDAICEFSNEYADQNLQDYRKFLAASRDGRVDVTVE